MTGAFHRLLVAIDGSDNAARALEVAMRLARATKAELVVAHAVGLLEEQTVHDVDPADRARAIERRVEEEWCAPLRRAGMPHRVLVLSGSPVPALLTATERVQADLIIVGTRGIGALGGRQLGSTSQQLTQEASVPVLVVPSPDH